MTRTVKAERVFSEFKNQEVWKCYVQVPSGKKYGFCDIIEPLKAIRYMMMLKNKNHAEIDEASFEAVRKANAEMKAAKANENTKEPEATKVENNETTEAAPKKERKTRRSKKETEVAA